jgi:hypothetical protein
LDEHQQEPFRYSVADKICRIVWKQQPKIKHKYKFNLIKQIKQEFE